MTKRDFSFSLQEALTMLRICSASFLFASISIIALPTDAATTSCSTVAACVMGTNSSSGPGAAGTSSSGFGVSGVSTSNHGVNGTSSSSFGVVGITTENSTSVNSARAGVYGEDSSSNNSHYNSGVAGLSHSGFGVLGESVNGAGVEGFSTSGGIFAQIPSYSGIGVYGNSNVGPGVYGYTTGTSGDSYGVGAYASGKGITSLFSESTGDGGSTFYARTHQDGYLFVGANIEHGNVASIDGSGNMVIAGTLTQNGSGIATTRTADGGSITTYSSRTSAPTVEDMGEATLSNGRAYVSLERTFASTIDPKANYLVFITARGASNALFVSGVSARGFSVQEIGNGRSSLAFDYRIVARPYDASSGFNSAKAMAQMHSFKAPDAPKRRL